MIKIDKKFFISNFLNNSLSIANILLLEQAKEEVIEFSIDKNFYYSLSQDNELRLVQERINESFLSKIELNNASVAFRKGISYFNFLEPHVSSYNFLRLDISSFFHSINVDQVRDIFSVYFSDDHLIDGLEYKLIDFFIFCVSLELSKDSKNKKFAEKQLIPIGFLTSPAISNIIFRFVDIKIQEFCQSKGIIYSRYADDMLFSSPNGSNFVHSDAFEKEISIYVSLLDMRLNKNKRVKRVNTISLNGYTIQSKSEGISALLNQNFDGIRISNKKTRIIEDIIYLYLAMKKSPLFILEKLFRFSLKSKFSEKPIDENLMKKYANDQFYNKISGYRSYLISALKFNNQFNCVSSSSLNKYRILIRNLEVILDELDV